MGKMYLFDLLSYISLPIKLDMQVLLCICVSSGTKLCCF